MDAAAAGLLIRARIRALKHRMERQGPRQRAGLWMGMLAIIAACLVIGHIKAPDLLIPISSSATPQGFEPKSAFVRGGAALELAFWLTVIASATNAFRVMELLFRRHDIRAIQSLPLPISAYFIDRLFGGLIEALGLGLLCALPFVPMLWHGAPSLALICAMMPLLGLLSTLAVGFGVQLWAGAAEYDTAPGQAQGQGQLFLYAPGAALAACAVLDLMIKLGLGEWLRTGRFGRPTQLVLGVVLGLSVVAVGAGYRYAQRGYLRMLAGFREADFMSVNVEIEYQRSAFDQDSFLTKRLSPAPGAIFKRHKLQYARRYMLTRYMYPIIWLIYGLGIWSLDQEAFPMWARISAPWIVLAALVNPWARLARPGLSAPSSLCLPVTTRDEALATSLFAAREVTLFIAPLLLLALILGQLKVPGVESALVALGTLSGTLGVAAACAGVIALSGQSPLKMQLAAIICAASLTALASIIGFGPITILATATLGSLGLLYSLYPRAPKAA